MKPMNDFGNNTGILGNYKFVVIFARYNNKWILCRHKDRITWELPGGHIEYGETTLEAAKRELYEETGVIDFSIIPVCDYCVSCDNGQVFLAQISTIGKLPESEIECIDFFETFPKNLTFHEDTNGLIPYVLDRINKLQEMKKGSVL